MSADDETRRMAEARELALFTEQIELDAAEKRGFALGATQATENAVRQLMANGMTEAKARSMLGLS
jgi:hypothetical protein